MYTKIVNNALVDVDSDGNILGSHIEPDEEMLTECEGLFLDYFTGGVIRKLRNLYKLGLLKL